MFKFCSLFSGSSGNCYLVQSDNTNILIDAGESSKKIEISLSNLQINPIDISAVLITHEHSDHVKGLGTFSKKFNIPVYANEDTWNAMPNQSSKIDKNNCEIFSVDSKFCIKDLSIEPFSIPHDAANPCGFNVFHENKKLSIATDIGHMTREIINYLSYSSFLLLEANYDPNVLKCASYPYSLKERIAGPNGHLSNLMAGKTISYLTQFGLKEVMLGHLSKESNFPELAYQTVAEQLMESSSKDDFLHLSVAKRYESSKIVEVS